MSSKLTGVLFTVASAACLSVTFVAGKQALLVLSPFAFIPLWFMAASLWGLVYYLLQLFQLPQPLRLPQPQRFPLTRLKYFWKPLLFLGLSSTIANTLFFSAVALGEPTVVAFFSRATTLFAVLLGVTMLQEQMTAAQWLGASLTIFGAALMTYQGGTSAGLILVLSLGASFFHALTSFIAKRAVRDLPPTILNIARTGTLALILGPIAFWRGILVIPDVPIVLWIIGGAFFGPFLSYILFYRGLKTLNISTAEVIRASQPLFVAVYGLILFSTMISPAQFFGGSVILVGVSLLLLPRYVGFRQLKRRLSRSKVFEVPMELEKSVES